MSRREDILRAEIDNLHAELIALRAEISDLKAEVVSLKAGIDDKIQSAVLHAQSEIIKAQLQRKKVSEGSES